MYRKNTAGQFVHFQGVDATTGGIKSGVTWTMRRCLDGTFAAGGGTVTEDGTTGWYKCALAQADTNGNNCAANFTGTGAVPQTVNFLTDGSPPDVNLKNAAGTAVTLDANNVLNVSVKYVGGTLQTAGDIYSKVSALTFTVANQVDVNVKDWAGSAVASAAAGIPKVDIDTIKTNPVVNAGTITFPAGATLASTTNLTAGTIAAVSGAVGSVTGNVGGNVVGSVGSVTGAVGSVTGSVGSVTGLTASDVGAIKTKTDQMIFTVANKIDANVRSVNSVTVNGAGSAGSPWGP